VLLRDPTTSTCQLFTGFAGTGKTTELRRLAERLRNDKQSPTHVVLIDFEESMARSRTGDAWHLGEAAQVP
jgi:signal recognition particle GTPase